MTMTPELAARRKAAYNKLDEVARELVEIFEIANDIDGDDDRLIPTDYALLVGSMFFDNDGDRNGCVTVFPRDGFQPPYITAGLLSAAKMAITPRIAQ